MTNRERNNYLDLPLCDTHFHLIHPLPVDDTVRIFEDIAEYYEFRRMTLCCMTRSGHRPIDPANNLKGLYIKSVMNEKRPDSVFVYGSPIHFYDERDTSDGYLKQVSELYRMGVDGYKMLDGKPTLRKKLRKPLCDPIFDKMYGFMEEHGMPLKIHLGDPAKYWGKKEDLSENAIKRGWWYGDGTYPTLDELRNEIDGILTKFPKLKLCLAHFYFLGSEPEKARAFFEKWEHVSFDLTPGASMFAGFTEQPDVWKRFFSDFRNRIFFGTDTYNIAIGSDPERVSGGRINQVRRMMEQSPDMGFEIDSVGFVKPMALDPEILRCIYFDNHKALHPTARPLDGALIAEKAQALSAELKDGNITYADSQETPLELENLKQIGQHFSV